MALKSIFCEAYSKLRVWGVPGVKDYVSKKIAWWRQASWFRSISRLDEGSVPSQGITLIGDFKQGGSNSKTNRDFAHALKDAGVPFQTYSIDRKSSVPESDYKDILTPVGDFRLHKYSHIVEMFRSP